ncbi:MAG: diheme cytochrome c [Paracoccaceae bacterium]|nr:diheme cytochrome c [Paracoccaceae bacterium]
MRRHIITTILSLAAAGAMTMQPTQAASKSPGTMFAEECSACHMAFDPGFLPKRSWRAIMGNLSNHFGEDASLDDQTRNAIERYLLSNAADANGRNPYWLRRIPASQIPMRITELPWFTNEHGARARAWAKSNPKIGSISNCQGCHRGAARGVFDDD